MKLIIVEDDEEIRNLIKYFLKKENHTILETSNGLEGLKMAREERPDLIILDVMLPGIDGLSICGTIREMPEKYGEPLIMMITAKTETEDLLNGLASGADDYVKKPFDPREIVMRVNTLFRRVNKETSKIFKFDNITIDEERHVALSEEEEIALSKKEYDLLLYFIKNRGLILTREKILYTVWGAKYYTGDRTVDVYVGKLRDKFQGFEANIKTVKGVGYKLEEKR